MDNYLANFESGNTFTKQSKQTNKKSKKQAKEKPL